MKLTNYVRLLLSRFLSQITRSLWRKTMTRKTFRLYHNAYGLEIRQRQQSHLRRTP